MDAMPCFLMSGMATLAAVLSAVWVLELAPRTARWGHGTRLAVTHTGLMLVAMGVAPLWIRAVWDSPYGDVYLPYLGVPGLHIYHPANVFFGDTVFPWLLGFMEPFPASVLTVVVGPGLVGLLVGGGQWYLVGVAWDRLFPRGEAAA